MNSPTDRELLEGAAKVAGIALTAIDNLPHQDSCRFWKHGDSCDCGADWNPLTDDGDALRLLVEKDFTVEFYAKTMQVEVSTTYGDEALATEWFGVGSGQDKAAATRRAIVRAAYAIAGEAAS